MKDYIPLFAIVALVALVAFVKRQGRKDAAAQRVEPVGVLPFPCIVEGTFGCPDRAVAIAARNASLIKKGHGIELPDNPDDNSLRNNTILGGGTPYGGIYLAGSLFFEIDAQGQATANSWIKIFSDEKYPVTGGLEVDGRVGMASPAGVTIAGTVRDGIVTMKISESGMAVDTGGGDTVYNALSEMDKQNIEGNHFGPAIEYVHGVVKAAYRRQ